MSCNANRSRPHPEAGAPPGRRAACECPATARARSIVKNLRAQGIPLPRTIRVTPDTNPKDHADALVIATPSALGSAWTRRFGQTSTAFASGWMRLRGVRRRRSADRGFVMSDHADWNGLNTAIKATGAERVYVTHGYTGQFRRWLESRGYDARIVETEFEGESLDASEPERSP